MPCAFWVEQQCLGGKPRHQEEKTKGPRPITVTSIDKDLDNLTLTLVADQDGAPVPDMPVSTVRMQLTEHEGGTRMELRSSFESREQMEQILEMGVAEGLEQAVGQMDALLADEDAAE